jgi:hypothetical protein
MKKPTIKHGNYIGLGVRDDSGKIISTEQMAEAYSDMIDALILCHELLLLTAIWDGDKLSSERKKDFDKAEGRIKQTLLKAGCKE